VAAALEELWSAEDTTPAAVDGALRDLLRRRHTETGAAVAPARVLNLVAVVDKRWRGEVANRLERVEHHHASRTIVVAVSSGRSTIDAWASMTVEGDGTPGALAVCRERVELEVGTDHLSHLDAIVAGVLATDIPTLVWAPHEHDEAVDALRDRADLVLIDSGTEAQVHVALARAAELAAHAHPIDMAWVRTSPWREHICGVFDPPPMRRTLAMLSTLTIRHRQDSTASGLLLAGWLASRLGWRVNALMYAGGVLQGKASGHREDVAIRLEPILDQEVPGPAEVVLATSGGQQLTFARVPGGMTVVRRDRKGNETTWPVLRSSRGEIGIFEEAVSQALSQDDTYAPALDAARRMLL
jgi:glucose-6-phosphate dehydrogenase assembly protein OpcA